MRINKSRAVNSGKRDKNSKKAVSDVMATILIVLIIIVAAGIIFKIAPLITNTLKLNQACTTARIGINTQAGYTCYDEKSKQARVMVERGPEEFEDDGLLLGLTYPGYSKMIVVKEDPSVVLSYHFDESTGNTSLDSSGKDNDGKVYNPKWSEGKYGNALELDGVCNMTAKNSDSLAVNEGLTIEFWVNISERVNPSQIDYILTRA